MHTPPGYPEDFPDAGNGYTGSHGDYQATEFPAISKQFDKSYNEIIS